MSESPPVSKHRRARPAANGGDGLLQTALVELRPRLQSAYCFLQLSADTAEPTFRLLSLETNEHGGVELSVEHRGTVHRHSLCSSVRFHSLSGAVTCEQRYVTFRAGLRPDPRRGTVIAEVLTADSQCTEPKAEPLWRPQLGEGHVYTLACVQCGHRLLQRFFQRVLPLPSENWREMLGNVFCHGDGADTDMHQRVRARSGDCFYAASHCVLSPADLSGCRDSSDASNRAEPSSRDNSVANKGSTEAGDSSGASNLTDAPACGLVQNGGGGELDSVCDGIVGALPSVEELPAAGRFVCAGCGALVGDRVEFGARVWHHCVLWTSECDRTGLRLQPGDVLRRLLTHQASSCDAPTARLLATAPRHGALLLWLVEPRLTVYVTSRGDSGAARRTALKILWRTCDAEEEKLHRSDLQVSALELDDVLMVTLLAELRDSLRWYPETQRTVGGDQLGLILL